MHLFIHQTHIHIYSPKEIFVPKQYDQVLNLEEESLKYNQLQGKTALYKPSIKDVRKLVQLVVDQRLESIPLIACKMEEPEATKEAIKKDFKIIKAGGGLVTKGEQLLMIHRLGKWDLPKGKMDEGETFKETAVREVEEECNIKVRLDKRICTTWHHYVQDNHKILKQTRWFLMHCLEDSQMKPQLEEDIHDIRWMHAQEIAEVLPSTYPSIQFVFKSYRI